MLRCLLVDDNPQFLAAARSLLEREGLVVAGTASTTADALRQVAQLRPDVTLVDIDLGGESGFDLARQVAEGSSPTPVIMISTHAEDDYADLIAASPAIGFVPKIALSARAVRTMLTGGDTDASATVSGPLGR